MKDYFLQIESYLTGELNPADRSDFEQALRADPELASLVNEYREMQLQLEGMRIRKKVETALRSRPKETGSGSMRWIWILSATGLCILLATLFFQKPNPAPSPVLQPASPVPSTQQNAAPQVQQPQTPPPAESPKPQKPTAPDLSKPIALAREYYAPATGNLVREVVESDEPTTSLQQAAVAFAEEKYQLVCDLLKDDSTLGTGENGRFLRANARFKAGLFRGALNDFKQLENSFKYRYEAQWNGLLCEIALGNAQKPAVKSALDLIIADPDHPFYEAAMALKKRL